MNPEQQQDQVKPDQSYNLIWRILINCRPSHSSNHPACCLRSLSFQPAHQQPAATVESPSNRPSPLATIKTYPATPPSPQALARPPLATISGISCHLSPYLPNAQPPFAPPRKHIQPSLAPLANAEPPLNPRRTCPATLRPTSQKPSHPTSHLRSHLIEL